MEPLTNLSVNRTGRVTTVGGYRCHQYVGTGKGISFVAWATEDIDTTGIPAFAVTAPQDIFPGILPGLSIQGVVMKSELQIDLGGVSATITSEVQRITRTVLPDALFVVPHTYATQRGIGPSPAERQATDRMLKEITRRRQGFERSARVGAATSQLSCPTTHDDLAPRYSSVYERMTLRVPITVTVSGKYMVRIKYESPLNRPSRDRPTYPKEQFYELPAGTHHVEFVFTFQDTLGMFVKASESQLEVAVHRYVSEHDIYGDIRPGSDTKPQYTEVITQTQRIPGVANVYINGLKGLRCPTGR
jgi:hypothetical protein